MEPVVPVPPPKNDENIVNQIPSRTSDQKDKKRAGVREEVTPPVQDDQAHKRELTGRSVRLSNGISDTKLPENAGPRLTVTPIPYNDSHKSDHVHRRDISLTAPILNGAETLQPERPQPIFHFQPGVEPIHNPVAPTIFIKKSAVVPEPSKEEKRERVPVIYKKIQTKPEPSRRSTTSQEVYSFDKFENDDKLFCFRN